MRDVPVFVGTDGLPMGQRLQDIVTRVQTQCKGLPAVSLARLNLRVGKPLSRMASLMPDDPDIVALAEKVADELLAEQGK